MDRHKCLVPTVLRKQHSHTRSHRGDCERPGEPGASLRPEEDAEAGGGAGSVPSQRFEAGFPPQSLRLFPPARREFASARSRLDG